MWTMFEARRTSSGGRDKAVDYTIFVEVYNLASTVGAYHSEVCIVGPRKTVQVMFGGGRRGSGVCSVPPSTGRGARTRANPPVERLEMGTVQLTPSALEVVRKLFEANGREEKETLRTRAPAAAAPPASLRKPGVCATRRDSDVPCARDDSSEPHRAESNERTNERGQARQALERVALAELQAAHAQLQPLRRGRVRAVRRRRAARLDQPLGEPPERRDRVRRRQVGRRDAQVRGRRGRREGARRRPRPRGSASSRRSAGCGETR